MKYAYAYKCEILNLEHFVWLLNEKGKEGWQMVSCEAGHKVNGWDANKVIFMRGYPILEPTISQQQLKQAE